jgi:hypothetical protein
VPEARAIGARNYSLQQHVGENPTILGVLSANLT